MEQKFHEDQIKEFQEAFNKWDKHGSGHVLTKDAHEVMKELNQNVAMGELEEMVKEIDKDGSGKIDFPEFLSLMARKMKSYDTQEELFDAFRTFDPEKTGFIATIDLKNALLSLDDRPSDEELNDLLKDADPNETGQIKYKDFAYLMLSN